MRSTSSSLAASMISCVATPLRNMEFAPTPLTALAESARPRKASSAVANSCSENAAAAGRPANAAGSCGSRTCNSVISEFRPSAMRSAHQRAFLDGGEKSVGTRIFLTLIRSYSAVGFGAIVADFMMTFCPHGKNLHDNFYMTYRFFREFLRVGFTAEFVLTRRRLFLQTCLRPQKRSFKILSVDTCGRADRQKGGTR